MLINKRTLYETLLQMDLEVENYEGAANLRDKLLTIDEDETIEVDDDFGPTVLPIGNIGP